MVNEPTRISVESAVYDQGIEVLRAWGNQALIRGDWRMAGDLTKERHALEVERDRVRNLEREAAKRKR